jgi:hypothetical protein
MVEPMNIAGRGQSGLSPFSPTGNPGFEALCPQWKLIEPMNIAGSGLQRAVPHFPIGNPGFEVLYAERFPIGNPGFELFSFCGNLESRRRPAGNFQDAAGVKRK